MSIRRLHSCCETTSRNFFATRGAEDINNQGEIVALNHYIAPDGVVSPLNSLVVDWGPTPNWNQLGGVSINAAGAIVGSELNVDAGTVRGFLLAVVPEPTSGMLLLATSVLLAFKRRR